MTLMRINFINSANMTRKCTFTDRCYFLVMKTFFYKMYHTKSKMITKTEFPQQINPILE